MKKTAKECISQMKEQRLSAATFLPLDTIKVKPIKEKLRQLTSQTVKLAIDVLQYDNSIAKAIAYACGNTLICSTLDEAKQLAFGGEERHKVVTLDGTLINKNGNMTGGTSTVETKAKRWDEKDIENFKKNRDKYQKELAELAVNHSKQTTQEHLKSRIEALNNRLKYSDEDLEMTTKKLTNLTNELTLLNDELNKIRKAFEGLKKTVDNRETEIKKYIQKINEEEDKIFQDFVKKME